MPLMHARGVDQQSNAPPLLLMPLRRIWCLKLDSITNDKGQIDDGADTIQLKTVLVKRGRIMGTEGPDCNTVIL